MIALQVPCLGSHIVDNGRGFGRTRRITPICQVNVEEGVSAWLPADCLRGLVQSFRVSEMVELVEQTLVRQVRIRQRNTLPS